MKPPALRIHCKASDLKEGLFGQVFLFLFEILPYLHQRSIYPTWEIRSKHYGQPPDHIAVPGVLDLAYTPPPSPYRSVHLFKLRAKYSSALGNNWPELSRLWNAYFKVPQRILDQADALPPLHHALGVHYRGNDKLTGSYDSNPITHETYLTLITEFLATRPDTELIFAATDDFAFIEKLRADVALPVLNLGEVAFHKAEVPGLDLMEKADRALLDCLLLSRCRTALQTSSALPSFAKVLNPDLEMYRCASSKLFAALPYFPAAYIPPIPLYSPQAIEILNITMQQDWTDIRKARDFRTTFTHKHQRPFRHRIWQIADKLTTTFSRAE